MIYVAFSYQGENEKGRLRWLDHVLTTVMVVVVVFNIQMLFFFQMQFLSP